MKTLFAIIASALAILLLAAVIASAEVVRVEATVAASTNATATLGATAIVRGILHRAIVTVSAGGTCAVQLIDTDGTVIWTNAAAAGATTILTNFPANGVQVKTHAANTTNKTVAISLTAEK